MHYDREEKARFNNEGILQAGSALKIKAFYSDALWRHRLKKKVSIP